MKKIIYLFSIISILGLSSCYMYEGPTRIIKKEVRDVLPPVEKNRPIIKVDSKKEYLDKAYKEIQGTLPEADVTMIEDSIKVLFPNNIVYQNKEMFPNLGYEAPLMKFSELLKKFKKTNILVTGHSDSRGNELKNKEISNTRAINIKNVIVQNGILESRLKAWGLGSVSPIADNDTPEGREKNRRVEFVVLYDEN